MGYLKKTLESPLENKIKPVDLEGNQPWQLTRRAGQELAQWGAARGWERLKAGGGGATEGGTARLHARLNGHEFQQALGTSEGQGSLACCSPCGHKDFDTTEWPKKEGKKSHYQHQLSVILFPSLQISVCVLLACMFICLQNSNQTFHLHLKFRIS